jgi:hypothetical protein
MYCAAAILCFLSLRLAAQETGLEFIELRETISKIVDTRTLESKERLDWEAGKAEMAALLELHQRELGLLNEELEKAGQSAPGHADSTEDLKAEIESLKAARRTASEAAARTIPRTLALSKRFPAPLQKDCETDLATLSTWKSGEDPRPALQAELSIFAKADQFNRRLTRVADIRANREVEVLYLGLAAAYYTGRGGNAGTGHPGPDGWVWNEQPGIADEINRIFDTLDKKRPPSMVKLPLEIK